MKEGRQFVNKGNTHWMQTEREYERVEEAKDVAEKEKQTNSEARICRVEGCGWG